MVSTSRCAAWWEKSHSSRMACLFSSSPPTETHVDIEDSVRGKDVFIVQTGSWSVPAYELRASMRTFRALCRSRRSTNDAIMELLIMCYACKTASARQVIGKWEARSLTCRGVPSTHNTHTHTHLILSYIYTSEGS